MGEILIIVFICSLIDAFDPLIGVACPHIPQAIDPVQRHYKEPEDLLPDLAQDILTFI